MLTLFTKIILQFNLHQFPQSTLPDAILILIYVVGYNYKMSIFSIGPEILVVLLVQRQDPKMIILIRTVRTLPLQDKCSHMNMFIAFSQYHSLCKKITYTALS